MPYVQSVFGFYGVHWNWFVWLDILLDQIKSLKITAAGYSQDIDTIAVLLDRGFPVRLAGCFEIIPVWPLEMMLF